MCNADQVAHLKQHCFLEGTQSVLEEFLEWTQGIAQQDIVVKNKRHFWCNR